MVICEALYVPIKHFLQHCFWLMGIYLWSTWLEIQQNGLYKFLGLPKNKSADVSKPVFSLRCSWDSLQLGIRPSQFCANRAWTEVLKQRKHYVHYGNQACPFTYSINIFLKGVVCTDHLLYLLSALVILHCSSFVCYVFLHLFSKAKTKIRNNNTEQCPRNWKVQL